MRRLVVATGGGAVIRPINWYANTDIYFSYPFINLKLLQYLQLRTCLYK